MSLQLRRRSLLVGGAAMLAGAALPRWSRAAGATPTKLTITKRTIEVKKRAAPAFGILQPDGTSGITIDPDHRFLVDLLNDSGEDSIIHWHGQNPPYLQDGYIDEKSGMILDKATHTYDYQPIPGTHWMHSHHGLQAQRQMNAPLIVRSVEDAKADVQEVVLFLDDFSFKAPEEILAGLTGGKPGTDEMAGMAGMGKGQVKAADNSMQMSGMDMKGMSSDSGMKGMAMGATSDRAPADPAMKGMPNDSGMEMSVKDLNDVTFDAFLCNERTFDDPMVVKVERNGRVRLRVINAAASTQFWITLGNLTGKVIAVDGHGCAPISGRKFPISMGQRLDIMLDLPAGGAYPVCAQVEGKKDRTGLVLVTPGGSVSKVADMANDEAAPVDLSLEVRLSPNEPLPDRPIDNLLNVALTGIMNGYVWSLNDQVWPKAPKLLIKEGQRVVIDMQNKTGMAHPMHLHGHAFQVIEINGNDIAGARRDTVLVPPLGQIKVAFDADNPGRWPFHCHNLYHQATGMMTELIYA